MLDNTGQLFKFSVSGGRCWTIQGSYLNFLFQAADAGQYKAVASNSSGESQATINLTFQDSGPGKPKIPDGLAPRYSHSYIFVPKKSRGPG